MTRTQIDALRDIAQGRLPGKTTLRALIRQRLVEVRRDGGRPEVVLTHKGRGKWYAASS